MAFVFLFGLSRHANGLYKCEQVQKPPCGKAKSASPTGFYKQLNSSKQVQNSLLVTSFSRAVVGAARLVSSSVFGELFVYIRYLQGALPGGGLKAAPAGKESIYSFDTRDSSVRILSQVSDGGLSALCPLPWGSSPS